jgi:deoxyribonuclease-2
MTLSAMDESGKPVDWWFMYKVAGKSRTGDGRKLLGTEYVYFDSNSSALTLSPHHLDQDGALPATLAQVFGDQTPDLGWYFYNDENPITGQVIGSRGHSKGVVAFDLASDSAFWLVQSTPKFPTQGGYSFPHTGMPNAQTLLCVTLSGADVSLAIAKQQFVAQQPNVHLASPVPQSLAGDPNDARVKLIHNQVAAGDTPVHVVIPFQSRAGVKFMSIAKNRTWGLDFYNDLVGPTLDCDLDCETWEHDPTPPPADSDNVHTVVDMKGIDLDPLGVDISWPEPDDHAKLALSAPESTPHYVCVGDINYTLAQRKRGGGTVAFQCEPLWAALLSTLVEVAPIKRVSPPTPAPV